MGRPEFTACPWPRPLAEALESRFDLGPAGTDFAKWWASVSVNKTLSEIVSGEREDVSRWLWGKQIAEIVALAPCAIGAQAFISGPKRLQQRLYSISSSPKILRNKVQLTVSVVRYGDHGNNRAGTASAFLADRAADVAIPIFVQPAAQFRPPHDPNAPAIMVGRGTGIAPFRAFLQKRGGKEPAFLRRATSSQRFLLPRRVRTLDEEWSPHTAGTLPSPAIRMPKFTCRTGWPNTAPNYSAGWRRVHISKFAVMQAAWRRMSTRCSGKLSHATET